MKQILFSILAFCISLNAFAGAGAKSFSTGASFGTSPSCSGKGICGTAVTGDNAVTVNFTYNAATKVMQLVINKQALADKGITAFDGDNYNFDQSWTTPGDMATALNNGTPITIRAGAVGSITDDGTNKVISFNITP